MTLSQINARLAEIEADLTTRADQLTADEINAYQTEVDNLNQQRTQLEAAATVRQNLLANIAAGRQGIPAEQQRSSAQAETAEDPRGTMEYRRAFMQYVRTGQWNDILQRQDAMTASTDISAVVPTTIMDEVIRKMTEYGQILSRIRRTAIPGGVQVPILSLKPTAQWITEAASSDRQKIQSNTSVTFSYFGLEVKVAQSLIATLVGLPTFEAAISEIIAEAMSAKLEADIFNGDGSGKVTGILVDTRVPSGNVVTLSSTDVLEWTQWKKKVFAKMPLAYKRNATFVMASGTWEGYIDGMVDDHGQPVGRVNYGITDGIQERFGGKEVIQVEDDVIKPYDTASTGDVIAAYLNLNNYALNSNMQLSIYRYKDEDTNQIIDKAILVADGKLLDTNGVILVKKGA